MLNKTMKKREILTLILTVLIAIFIYQRITVKIYHSVAPKPSFELINDKEISSQKLFDNSWKIISKKYINADLNSQDWNYWKKRYEGKIKTDDDAKVAIDTMLASLNDPYSRFLDKKEYEEQHSSIDAYITGIGVNITTDSGKTIIHDVLEGTPAFKAGLKEDDIIVMVDNKDINGMDLSSVASIIRGPINSTVILKIKRGNKYFIKTIKREKIEIKSVEHKIIKNNIGYIKIKSFMGTNTSTDFIEALKSTEGTDGLILDLRGNTGGLLYNAVVISNLFIDHGKIVSIVYRNGEQKDIRAKNGLTLINKPTVVLVNERTASASEIVSGALKDNKKAILVGTKTYGKGLVQQIIPMENKTGINITTSKYLTPNGSDINKTGIAPDYVIPYSLLNYKLHNDVQLKKAESIIAEMIKH